MSHANRGVGWERVLEGWHDRYRRDQRGIVFRTPPAVRLLSPVNGSGRFSACFQGDGPPDYAGVALGEPVAFDAKSCSTLRWPFGSLERHQARDLESWHVNGGTAFVALDLAGIGWVLPWAELGPRWWTWHERQGRASARAASLGQAELEDWAWPMADHGDWLAALRGVSR